MAENNSLNILKQFWNYNSFRPSQSEIIDSVLAGKDTLAVLPTGGGKSLCFQVPAMQLEGLCLVITPLIALMKDQVSSLRKKGINALELHSGLNIIEVKKILQNAIFGNYKFLYVSPERLESSTFIEYLNDLPLNLIAVDEAHCVSQWGYDFRPPYLRIASIREFFPKVPVLALTASATKGVRSDIIEKLCFKTDYNLFQQSFERPNLSYSVFEVASKETKLLEILKNVNGSGIVYCKSRKKTKELADFLFHNNISSAHYHAGLTPLERSNTQIAWLEDKIRIICSTNAFGMGIDKGNVSTVIHYDVTDALENYYQEAGRAGRNGNKAYAVLLYRSKELTDLKDRINVRFPSKEVILNVYKSLVNYLQLPSESGEGMYFDFNLNDFCFKFKLTPTITVFALKALEQEHIIAYIDDVFIPSKVLILARRDELEIFYTAYPDFEQLIKALLRSYDGIMDYQVSINEKQLEKHLSSNEQLITQHLIMLHNRSILEYVPQKVIPQIQFLKNRVKAADLYINEADLSKRKAAFEKRTEGMISYVRNNDDCRSRQFANYFEVQIISECKICDNCINKNEKSDELNVSKRVETLIQNIVTSENVYVEEILTIYSAHKPEVWKTLDFLIAEGRIIIDKSGRISTKKKGPR
ncbi:MAG: ATP-dependent DNA helicase RecQ [Ginsengibacter sp.]